MHLATVAPEIGFQELRVLDKILKVLRASDGNNDPLFRWAISNECLPFVCFIIYCLDFNEIRMLLAEISARPTLNCLR
jgi:hypothetical protein